MVERLTGSGRDPGVPGSSPTSGSLQGACFSLCLCLCASLSLCVSLMNKKIKYLKNIYMKEGRNEHYWIRVSLGIKVKAFPGGLRGPMIRFLAHLAELFYNQQPGPGHAGTPRCSVNCQLWYQGLCTCCCVFLEYSSPERMRHEGRCWLAPFAPSASTAATTLGNTQSPRCVCGISE